MKEPIELILEDAIHVAVETEKANQKLRVLLGLLGAFSCACFCACLVMLGIIYG